MYILCEAIGKLLMQCSTVPLENEGSYRDVASDRPMNVQHSQQQL